MRYIAILLLILGLGACDSPREDRFAEYKGKSEYTIEYEILDSIESINKRYDEIWIKQKNPITKRVTEDMYGFAYDKGTKCIIVMAKPSEYTLQELERTLGHEHLHCIYGAWHK